MSSRTGEWKTPDSVFSPLFHEFDLEIDVCATPENAKIDRYFTKLEDGLSQDWSGLRCWMNPPYGREIGAWVRKAATGGAAVVVALLPARTDTRWFHEYIYGKAEIRFLKGRIRFSGSGPAPFPSMVVVFRK